MDKKQTKAYLKNLYTEGLRIYFAGVSEYNKDYINYDHEFKGFLEQAIKNVEAPRGNYHLWYMKTCKIVRSFAPERLKEFEEFYTGTIVRDSSNDLTSITAGITHYLQRKSIIENDAEVDFFYVFESGFREQIHILIAIADTFDDPFFNIEKDIRHRVYESEMDIAKDIQDQGHLKIAGAVAGVIIEAHLKTLVAKKDLPIKTQNNKPPTMDDYNNALKGNTYDTTTWHLIKHCGAIRNDCTHSNQDKPTADETKTIIRVAEQIIADYN